VTEGTRPRRKYDSRRRREQAAATRRTMLEAAQRLFERDGYVATTMESVAAGAGVALKTVYAAFGTKGGLLRALWDLQLKGDADDAPVAERDWYREVLEEARPERQLALNARNVRVVRSRIGTLLGVIRSAAVVDADCAALWHLIETDFYDNQRVIVESIDARGGLRDGLDVTRATDILWTLNHPDVWLLLVGGRGWSPEEFESWFTEVTGDQLLGRRPRRRAVTVER
jgi:AcrR family transcriptional regulator